MRNRSLNIRLWMMYSGLAAGLLLHGQDIPSKPLSIPVYHPMVLNPAYAGSKDYTNISFTTKAHRSPDSQVLNLHQRYSGPGGEFTRIGIGAYAFQEQLDESWNAGLAVTGAYHIPLDAEHLHNIAAGVSVKGIFAVPKKGLETVPDTFVTLFIPNLDAGIYYYGPHAFAGISSTTLFSNDGAGDTTLTYGKMDREYHLYGGYKFLLSRKLGIILEPSLLLSLNDSTFSEPHKHLVPYLKLYIHNVYVGTCLKDLDTFALFFQYQFPRLYTGVFLEFPRVGYLNNDNIIIEVSVGVNLGRPGTPEMVYGHW